MADPARALRGVLLPLGQLQLLVPAAVVAEIVAYVEPEVASSWPDWVLGFIPWHGCRLPLVSVEAAMGLPPAAAGGQRSRIVVLHTLDGGPGLPRYALLVRDTPRVMSIWPEFLNVRPSKTVNEAFVRLRVTLADGESAVIPDLDALQDAVLAADGLLVRTLPQP